MIDVFICTHERHKELPVILNSLIKVKEPKIKTWVIDSSEKSYTKRKGYEYIHKPDMKALSKKRNLAIKISKADYVAFTDDDCIADKNWIKEMIKGFEIEKVVCCTGLTLACESSKNSEYEKRYGFSKIGNKEKIISKKFIQNLWRIGHGNNMVFKKEIFSEIGLFDEKLGVGSEGLAGEDTDMFYRILKKGYKVYYNPKAIVYHKHLIKDSDLSKVAYRNGYSTRKQFIKNFDFNFLINVIILLSRAFFGLFTRDKKSKKAYLRGILGFKQGDKK